MRNLLLGNFLLLLVSSCIFPINNRFQKIEKRNLTENELKSIFSPDRKSYIFKTQINYKENYFGGVMVIKFMSEDTMRLVFITELGIKVFDMEFSKEGLKVHYCLEAINKKKVLSTIKDEFQLLFMNNLKSGKALVFKDKKGNHHILKLKDGLKSNYYFIDIMKNELLKIEQYSLGIKKMDIRFSNYAHNFPGIIKISHENINLAIQLKMLK